MALPKSLKRGACFGVGCRGGKPSDTHQLAPARYPERLGTSTKSDIDVVYTIDMDNSECGGACGGHGTFSVAMSKLYS